MEIKSRTTSTQLPQLPRALSIIQVSIRPYMVAANLPNGPSPRCLG